MTQEQVIARIDKIVPDGRRSRDRGQLSRIETGENGYSEWWLVNLAKVYECEPADLLRPPPTGGALELITMIRKLNTDRQVEVTRAFVQGVLESAG